MDAIRVKTHLDSETVHLPQLKPLIGRDVEIIVMEDNSKAGVTESGSKSRKTLEQLAAEQGKKPITDLSVLLGGWPIDELNDGFEEDLRARRKEDIVREIHE